MRRFLWAGGRHAAAYTPGSFLDDRYLCQAANIFLDTKPAALPSRFEELPTSFVPYLKLSPYQLHVPQVYDWIRPSGTPDEVILLLEQAPLWTPSQFKNRGILVSTKSAVAETEIQVLPKLVEIWQTASPMRQLNWLWQVAKLWEPLNQEGVASTLIDLELMRVEGGILRLLELHQPSQAFPLSVIGEFWLEFAQTAHPMIQTAMQRICQQLMQEQIRNAEGLMESLDSLLANVQHRSQQIKLQIGTLSDQGPTRHRNEDACYPVSGTITTLSAPPLVIVCDGIGGHQGGDVASNLAIQTIEQQVQSLDVEHLDAITLSVELEKAVCAANDRISQQNDSEQRFDRQRMGTTVVMGLAHQHELYVTHVGDSRVYWITRWGCHQITQDDDVASREVRLGYSTYVQALQQPSSGSLVQALGMGNSKNLYPTVQRFVLDEDSVFLFCSDGLSDNEQVDRYWESVILPLLDEQTDLATVCQQLIEIANTQNGYDNATVGVVHCKVVPLSPADPLSATTAPALVQPLDEIPPTEPRTQSGTLILPSDRQPDSVPVPPPALSSTSQIKTQQIEPPRQAKFKLLPLIGGIIALAGVAGILLALLFRQPTATVQQPSSPEPSSAPSDNNSVTPIPKVSGSDPVALQAGTLIRAQEALLVQTVPPELSAQTEQWAAIPAGSLIYLLAQQSEATTVWMRLTICPDSTATPVPSATLSPSPTLSSSPTVSPNSTLSPSPTPQAAVPPSTPVPTSPQTPLKPQTPLEKSGYALLKPGQIAWIQKAALAKVVTQFTPTPTPASPQVECRLPENF